MADTIQLARPVASRSIVAPLGPCSGLEFSFSLSENTALTREDYALMKGLAKRLAERERKIARESDTKKNIREFEGLHFITFMNFINFETFPVLQ